MKRIVEKKKRLLEAKVSQNCPRVIIFKSRGYNSNPCLSSRIGATGLTNFIYSAISLSLFEKAFKVTLLNNAKQSDPFAFFTF